MSTIITIGREFGSGGHIVGEMLSQELGIPYYDNELIAMAVDYGEIQRGHPLDKFDEKKTNPWLFEVNYTGNEHAPKGESMEEVLFKLQQDVMKDIAAKGNAIIVGRCADKILKEAGHTVISVFVAASMEQRTERIMHKYDVEEAKAISIIKKRDKRRKSFYEFHTGKEWGNPKTYDYYFHTDDLSLLEITNEIVRIYEGR